jgi:hypothetical protein
VTPASPTELDIGAARPMYAFQELEPEIVEVLARTIRFRPGVFWVGLAAAGVLALVLIHYALAGAARLTRNESR